MTSRSASSHPETSSRELAGLEHAEAHLESHYVRLPYRRFLVLSSPRSGTHMLRTSLNAHPNIVCMTEMFNPDYTARGFDFAADTAVERILADHVYLPYPPGIDAVGFLLQRSGARCPHASILWPLLERDLDLQVVSLRRENLLRRYLSQRLRRRERQHLGASSPPPDLERTPPEPIKLEFDHLIRDFEHQEHKRLELDRRFAGHRVTTVSYEELCHRYDETLNRLQRFLGVPPIELRPKTRKRAIPPLSQIVSNYRELKKDFADTAWAEFWDE